MTEAQKEKLMHEAIRKEYDPDGYREEK